MTNIDSEPWGDNGSVLALDAATRFAQLAWAIGSAPLLNHALSPHAAITAVEAANWWAEWQPSSPPMPEAHGRLGSDFEQLWQFWLGAHPRWQMLAHNLQIREQNRTLGEFDLLVRDRHSGEQEHWELAVKFYLGYGDLDQPACWHGPQFRDRLDRKLVHLRNDQLCWKDRPAGQVTLATAALQPTLARALIKGRLCYPLAQRQAAAAFAAPGHERGYWATARQWQQWLRQQTESVAACALTRTEWLAARADCIRTPLQQWLETYAENPPDSGKRPLALRLWCGEDYWPMIFIVPEEWPERAAQHQHDA